MAWITRNEDGSIKSVRGPKQPGQDFEWLEIDDPEVAVFLNPPDPPLGDQIENAIARHSELSAIVCYLAKQAGLTEREVLDGIRAEAKGG